MAASLALVGRPRGFPLAPGRNCPLEFRLTGGLCHGRTGNWDSWVGIIVSRICTAPARAAAQKAPALKDGERAIEAMADFSMATGGADVLNRLQFR